jgi:hypothetical protein
MDVVDEFMDVVDRDQPRAPSLPYGLATLFKLALWVYAVGVVVSSFAAPVGQFDDALPLVHGALVQGGRTPSVDFWSFYPGVILYLYAAAFSVFGKTVMAARLVGGILFCLVLLGSVRLLSRLFPESRSLAPLHALILGATVASVVTSPAWPGYAVALLAFLTYLSANENLPDYRLRLGLSGALAGLAVMCRVNFAGYVVFVAIVDLALGWWLLGQSRWATRQLKLHMTYASIFFAAMLATLGTVAAVMYGRHVGLAMSQFVVEAARVMATRGFIDLEMSSARLVLLLAFPCGWFWLRMLSGRDVVPPNALIPVACGLVILVTAATLGHDRSVIGVVVGLELVSVLALHLFVQRLERPEFCLVLFSGISLHYFLSRADQYHWRFLLTGPALLLPFLLFRGLRTGAARPRLITQTGTALAITVAVMCSLLMTPRFRIGPRRILTGAELIHSVAQHPGLSDSDRVLGLHEPDPVWNFVYQNKDERKALRYLRSVTNGYDPIFVGVQEQSRVFVNNLRIYWLADRPIGVRAFQLETQVATEAAVQREQIADLELNRVNWMIIDRLQEIGDTTFWKRGYRGAADFDDYVSTHYVEKARFGRFSILQREPSLAAVATSGDNGPKGLALVRALQ